MAQYALQRELVEDIRNYGAVADSGVTDNYAPILAAMDALAAQGGGTLYIPDGHGDYYGVDTRLSFGGDEYSNITIRGDGYGSWIKPTFASSAGAFGVIHWGGDSPYSLRGIAVRDIRISAFNDTSDQAKLLSFSYFDGLLVDGVYLDTSYMEGLYLNAPSDSRNVKVRNCHATRVGMLGLSAFNLNADGASIIGCSAYDVGQFVEQTGYDFVCTGNNFRKASTYGINMFSTWSGWLESSVQMNSRRAIVSDNVIDDCPVAVVLLDPDGTGTGNPGYNGNLGEAIIADNVLTNCRQAAVLGSDEGGQVIFSGNLCKPSAASDNKPAVELQNKGNGPIIVTNNHFFKDGANDWAYIVQAISNNAAHVIEHNTIHGLAWNSSLFSVGGTKAKVGPNTILPGSDTITGQALSLLSPAGNGQNWLFATDQHASGPLIYGDSVRSEAMGPNAPTALTWKIGDVVYSSAPASTGFLGWTCTVAGTAGTLSGKTGSITSGAATLTMNSVAGLYPGAKIIIAGVTGIKTILSISGLVVTLDSNASATVSGAAVSYSAPTFKTFGAVTP